MPWLIRRVNQRYRHAIATSTEAAGFGDLSPRAYWGLTALAAGADDAGRLVADLGVSKQAISKLVDMVVESGYVERLANEEDRRRTVLHLTAKGRKAVAVVEQAVRATQQEFAAELGAAPFAELTRMLQQLARNGR